LLILRDDLLVLGIGRGIAVSPGILSAVARAARGPAEEVNARENGLPKQWSAEDFTRGIPIDRL
jgi:hypothetical protein